jgi:hypothetical protein
MKDRSNKQDKHEAANVEFGIEFGDINAAKIYEYQIRSKEEIEKMKGKKK